MPGGSGPRRFMPRESLRAKDAGRRVRRAAPQTLLPRYSDRLNGRPRYCRKLIDGCEFFSYDVF